MKRIIKSLFVMVMIALLVAPTLAVSAESLDTPPNPIPSAATGGASNTVGATNLLHQSTVMPHSKLVAGINEGKKINGDTKAYLYVPNTNMNYPIVQGKDNVYYEKRKFNGQNLPNNNWRNYQETAVYLDYRVKLGKTWEDSSNNIVLYGHNWNNLRKNELAIGNYPQYQMFAQLPSYTNMEFAKNNPYIYFSTGEMEGIWKVFAVGYCESDPTNFPFNSPNINGKTLVELGKEWEKRSLYKLDVDVKEDDQIITLATCTRVYGKEIGGAQTYAVVARRLRPGESDTTPVNIVANENVKQPSFVSATAK